MARVCWWFFFSKVIELSDTVCRSTFLIACIQALASGGGHGQSFENDFFWVLLSVACHEVIVFSLCVDGSSSSSSWGRRTTSWLSFTSSTTPPWSSTGGLRSSTRRADSVRRPSARALTTFMMSLRFSKTVGVNRKICLFVGNLNVVWENIFFRILLIKIACKYTTVPTSGFELFSFGRSRRFPSSANRITVVVLQLSSSACSTLLSTLWCTLTTGWLLWGLTCRSTCGGSHTSPACSW